MDENLAAQFDRLPPSSNEAEICLVGSMMLDQNVIDEVRQLVNRSHFYQADHQVIFDAIISLRERQIAIDAITLRDELGKRGLLEEIGGTAYLGQILGSIPSAAHAAHYARIVREKGQLRQLIELGNEIVRRAYGPSLNDTATELAMRSMEKLASIVQSSGRSKITKLDEILLEVHDQMMGGGAETIPTGFTAIDDQFGGIGIGEETIIAGRPSMGKSILAKQIAVRCAQAGTPAAIISLEEGRCKIGRNLLSSEICVDNKRIRNAKLTREEWDKVTDGIRKLSPLPLFVAENVRRTDDIANTASLLAGKHGVRLIVVDHLQRIHAKGKDRYEQVTNASQAMSDLWKELNVAGVLVAQLNRALETRNDRRPVMSDLRESGAIEQDADGILFLHREDYYHLDESDYMPTGEAELIVGKWRDGVRGIVLKLRSEVKYQRFADTHEPSANIQSFD